MYTELNSWRCKQIEVIHKNTDVGKTRTAAMVKLLNKETAILRQLHTRKMESTNMKKKVDIERLLTTAS